MTFYLRGIREPSVSSPDRPFEMTGVIILS